MRDTLISGRLYPHANGEVVLFTLGHGDRAVMLRVAEGPARSFGENALEQPDEVPIDAVVPAGTGLDSPSAGLRSGAAGSARSRFGYLCPGAPVLRRRAATDLDALADAMIPSQEEPETESGIPPALTYFGQFIDHDITANTDRDQTGASPLRIDPMPEEPGNRSLVVQAIDNLRKGTLGLDSVYGDGPGQPDEVLRLERALRDGARMRLGENIDNTPGGGAVPFLRPPLPTGALKADLPRVGDLLSAGVISEEDLLGDLVPSADEPDKSQRAFIGDHRNDENLLVSQLHVGFLRFHNAVVDWLSSQPNAPTDEDKLFERARVLVRRHYQWLIVNEYLATLCDPIVLKQVLEEEAPLYAAFLEARAGQIEPGSLPLPLEFSVAAFRFGHSMIRGAYDHNLNFGPDGGRVPATFNLLFQFTGRQKGGIGINRTSRLESNWIIEWHRFTSGAGPVARQARAIDTRIAPPLADMVNEGSGVFRHLAQRNLRRGYVLNIPSAQGVAAIFAEQGAHVTLLSAEDLASGPTGGAVSAFGFDQETPLWFYVLKEAEHHGGRRLGPLGSRIVSETLVGLLVNDPDSYWHVSGSSGSRWSPEDGARPAGEVIDGLASLLRAAGVHS